MVGQIIKSVDHISRKHPNTSLLICGDFNQLQDMHPDKELLQPEASHWRTTRTKAILDKIYTDVDQFYARP